MLFIVILLIFFYEDNNEIFKTIKSIKNVNQLSYVINDYQTIIEKFY